MIPVNGMVLVKANVEKDTVSKTTSGLMLVTDKASAIRDNAYTEGIVIDVDSRLPDIFKVGDTVGFDYNTEKAVGVPNNYLVPYINIRYIK